MGGRRLLPRLRMVLWAPGVGAGLVAIGLLAWLLPGLVHQSVGHTLHSAVDLLVPGLQEKLEQGSPEDLQRWVGSLAEGTGVRLTLIDRQGVVLADSARGLKELSGMDNHASRPEVIAAQVEGRGIAVRRSDTTGRQYVYAARLVTRPNGEVLYLRAARPLVELELLDVHLLRLVLVMIVGAGLGAMLVVSWIRRRVLVPFDALVGEADRLAQSDLGYRVAVPAVEELEVLANSLNRLAERAEEHVAGVDLERRRLVEILDGMEEGVLVTAANQRPLFANGSWYRLFEIDPQAPAEELLGLARRPPLFELLRSLHRNQERTAVQLEVEDRHIEVSAHHVAAFEGSLLVARDTTEAKELSRVRRDFVANVSHELKTPLAIIRAAAETVESIDDDGEARRRFTGRILEQCRRLEELLGDLLTLSRLESREVEARREPTDLEQVVGAAIDQLQPLATDSGVELRITVEGETELLADPYAMERLFLNLLSNGIKYGGEGGFVHTRLRGEPAVVVIEVEDGGGGIEPGELDRIFERFYRVEKGRGRDSGGSGLGLSIVKHIVQAHGGEIAVRSRRGEGTRFEVSLPKVHLSPTPVR